MLTYSLEQLVAGLSEVLGQQLSMSPLYQQAFLHSSFVNERHGRGYQSNERLEFLGDAVIELAVSEYLFQRFSASQEGQLTRLRAAVVCTPALARLARSLELGRWLRLSKGELVSGGRDRESILADTFESLIGAIYLVEGWTTACRIIEKLIQKEIEHVMQQGSSDYKTLLQQFAQARGWTIRYRLIEEHGPDHSKTFVIGVEANGKRLAVGEGRNKKIAEQQAARLALQALESSKIPVQKR